MGRRERSHHNVDLDVLPVTEMEYRNAGLNILDAMPDQDDGPLADQYIDILQSLGFGE